MFSFLPTGSTATTSRRASATLTIALLCAGLFVRTEWFDARDDSLADARAWLTDHPYLASPDVQPRPSREVLRSERAELSRILDEHGGLQRRLALVPARGWGQLGWLTNIFLHFGLMHLLGNLLFLWLVGPLLEEAWGSWRFTLFYLAGGVLASVVQFGLEPSSFSAIGGASGAIACCMGAFSVRFATTKIRFHYFLWFLRIFIGTFHLPAWVAGLLWFGRELLDLSDGGASGVATGAHVGGFVVGGAVALAMKGLGYEKDLLTVAEGAQQQREHDGHYQEALSALLAGDFERAREALHVLHDRSPDFPGAGLLLAEVDVRSGRGVARLERELRAMPKGDTRFESTLVKLWPQLEPKAFTEGFAWQLVERLRGGRHDGMVDDLLEALEQGGGRVAVQAKALKLQRGAAEQEQRSSVLSAEPAAGPRVFPVSFLALDRAGLTLEVEGRQRLIPFAAIRGVFAGVVPAEARRELMVDVALHAKPGAPTTVLRLSGADARLPPVFPTRTVPDAWKDFISALRKLIGQSADAAWHTFGSEQEFLDSWYLSL